MKIHVISCRPGLWIAASGLGATIGAALACLLFPDAAFAQNPTGHFRWSLVGFASTLGLLFALFQSALLAALISERSRRARTVVLLWVPVTAASVVVMIFPLWWIDAELLLMLPIAVPIYMFPGIALLAAGQTLLIHAIGGPLHWFRRTAIGAAIGALIGLPAVIMVGPLLPNSLWPLMPWLPETIWAGIFGLLIGVMQRRPLQRLLLSTDEGASNILGALWAVIREAASL